jgi:hypothetical protein
MAPVKVAKAGAARPGRQSICASARAGATAVPCSALISEGCEGNGQGGVVKRKSVLAMCLVAVIARGGESPTERKVEYSWMTFPSGVTMRKVLDAPKSDGDGKQGAIGITYLISAGSDPFERGVVVAVRRYLSAKSPGAGEVVLGAWITHPDGEGIASMRYRSYARQPNGEWKRDDKSIELNVAAEGAGLSVMPLERDRAGEAAARAAIVAWLHAFDRGDFVTCWASSSNQFRAGLAEQEWRTRAAALAKRLGPRVGRRELARHYGRMPGVSGGTYVTVEYRPTFRRAGEVVETVSAAACGPARWCVTGWNIAL